MNVLMPQLGETVTEGTVANWHKKVGDTVARDENLADLETDKVVLEVPAPTAGVVKSLEREAGATVTSGQLLAVIEEQAGAAAAAKPGPKAETRKGGDSGKPDTGTADTAKPAAPAPAAAKREPAAPAAKA